jgi:hypothetical protein
MPSKQNKQPCLRTLQRRRKRARDKVFSLAAQRAAEAAAHRNQQQSAESSCQLGLFNGEPEGDDSHTETQVAAEEPSEEDAELEPLDLCREEGTGAQREDVRGLQPPRQFAELAVVSTPEQIDGKLSTTADGYFKDFMAAAAKHPMSQEAKSTMWDYFRKQGQTMHRVAPHQFKTFRTMDRGLRSGLNLPDVLMDIECIDPVTKETGMLLRQHRLHQRDDYRKRNYVIAYATLESLLDLHTALHGGDRPEGLVLGIDGIPESKSGGKSLYIVSAQFLPCLTVYAVQIFRPMMTKDITPEKHFGRIVREIRRLGIPLIRIVADAPLRAILRGITAHNGNLIYFY